MADIHIVRPHSLGRQAARGRVQQAIDDLARDWSSYAAITSNWLDEDRLRLSASGVDGQVEVRDGEIEVALDLSFPASMLQDRIEAAINRKLAERLA